MTNLASTLQERLTEAAARGDVWALVVLVREALAQPKPLGDGWRGALRMAEQIGDDFGAVLVARRYRGENPTSIEAAFLLAAALTQAGKPDEGAELLEPLHRSGALSANQSFKFSRMLMLCGRQDDAQAVARRLLASQDASASLWGRIAQTKVFVASDPDIDAMEASYERTPDSKAMAKREMAYALAKSYVDVGDDKRAARYLDAKSRFDPRCNGFDSAALRESFEDIVRWCSSAEIDEHAEPVDRSDRPIFIVGPARSGTSLIDQMLSQHSAVFGGGELKHFWLASRALRDYSSSHMRDYEHAMQREKPSFNPWRVFGERYLALADERFGPRGRISDKVLSNIFCVRAIRRSLPGARFVFVDRDPVDVAWSCWQANFDVQSSALGWSATAEGIATYVLGCQRAMSAWAERYPEAITRLSYEQLVTNPMAALPPMLEDCCLPFEQAVLHPELSRRPVVTLSFTQARQPIGSGSIKAVERFPEASRKLRAALDAARR